MSGSNKSSHKLTAVRRHLSSDEIPFDVYTTIPKGNIENLQTKLAQGYSDLLVIGGDGTLNHALNANKDLKLTFSLIPSGTGNDFAKNINIGKDFSEHVHTAIHGTPIPIDMGQCNDRLFANGVGMGFDGQIVHDMLHRPSILSGHAKYYAEVLRILATYKTKKLPYTIEEQSFHDKILLLVVGNGTTFGGGFKLTPQARIDDKLLDVCTIGDVSPIRRFLNIHRLNKGTHGVLREINHYQTSHLRIEAAPEILAHIDGEFLGSPPFDIKVLPSYFKMRLKTSTS